MSIQKKSLISTLKTAKKANVASQGNEEISSKPSNTTSKRYVASHSVSKKSVSKKHVLKKAVL